MEIEDVIKKSREAISQIRGGKSHDVLPQEFIVGDVVRFPDSMAGGYTAPQVDKTIYAVASIKKGSQEDIQKQLIEISTKETGSPVIAKMKGEGSPDDPDRYFIYGRTKDGSMKMTEVKAPPGKPITVFDKIEFPEAGKPAAILADDQVPKESQAKIKALRAHVPVKQDLIEAQTDPGSKAILQRAVDYNRSGTAAQKPIPLKKDINISFAQFDQQLIRAGNEVEVSGVTECMGFAALAYAKLRQALPPDVPLLLVNDGLHKMVLIGYDGNDNPIIPGNLDPAKVYLADVWALAMGHTETFDPQSRKYIESNGIYNIDAYKLRDKFFNSKLEIVIDSRDAQKELTLKGAPAPEAEVAPDLTASLVRAQSSSALAFRKMAGGNLQLAAESARSHKETIKESSESPVQPQPAAVETSKVEMPAEPPKPQGYTLTSGTPEPGKISISFDVDKKSGTLDAVNFEFTGSKGPEKITMSSQELMKAMGMRLSEYKPIRETIVNANSNEERLAALKSVTEKIIVAVAQKSPEAGVTPQKSTHVVSKIEAEPVSPKMAR